MPCKKQKKKNGGCNLGILKNKKHEAIRLVSNFYVREISINRDPDLIWRPAAAMAHHLAPPNSGRGWAKTSNGQATRTTLSWVSKGA
jgi:hypothetical protein